MRARQTRAFLERLQVEQCHKQRPPRDEREGEKQENHMSITGLGLDRSSTVRVEDTGT